MSRRRVSSLNAILFFAFWLAVLYAGAASSLLRYGEPTVRPQASSYLIWLCVVGVVGAATAAAIYMINLMVIRLARTR